MKKWMMICLMAIVALAGTAKAQNTRQRMSEEDMQKMMQKRIETQAKELKLTDAQKESFIKLLTEYRTQEMKMRRGDENKAREDNGENKKKKELTDAEAQEKIEKELAQEEQQIKLKSEYFKKMLQAGIPASKLTSIFGRSGGMNRNMNRQRSNNGQFGGPGMNGGFPGGGPGMGGGFPGGGF